MCDENILNELAMERIYTEVKKIFLKSKKISTAFTLLHKLNGLKYFPGLDTLNHSNFLNTIHSLDKLNRTNIKNDKLIITLSLSVLCYKFTKQESEIFITHLTNDKKLLNDILSILKNDFQIHYTDQELYILATEVHIENYLLFSQAIHGNIKARTFEDIKQRAIKLGILHKKAKAYLQGRDIIEFGLSPSKEFSHILDLAYKAQMKLEINSHKEAVMWLENYFKSL